MFAPVFVQSAGLGAVGRQHTSSEQARWAREKDAYEAAHDGASGIVDAFERYAVQRADAKTTLDTGKVTLATAFSGLIAASAAVSALGWFAVSDQWAYWLRGIFTFLATVTLFPYIYSAVAGLLVIVPNPYFVCVSLMEAMETCTDERRAAAEGLPHLPIDTADGLWKWFTLRRLFVTDRFNMYYELCSSIVAALTLSIMGILLFIALAAFVFGANLFTMQWQVFVVVALVCVLLLIYMLGAVASVYPAQSRHVRVLTDAKHAALFSAAQQSGGEGKVPTSYAALRDDLEAHIKNEDDSPHVFGINVKPTFFYAVIAYVATTVLAFLGESLVLHW
eukprot:g632.t1